MKEWIIPTVSPDFVCAMEEVLDVYQRPYNSDNPVVCLDESPCQLIGETRPSYIDEKGVEHIDYEYKRNGTVDLYMVTEPLGMYREVLVRDQHTRLEWAEIVAHIVEEVYPDASKITLVQDNLKAHKKSALYELYEPERARKILKKIEFVFTPKHGSWLNIAECELSVLQRQQLSQRIESKEKMETLVAEWSKQRNEEQGTVDWQFTTEKSRVKLKRLYPSIES